VPRLAPSRQPRPSAEAGPSRFESSRLHESTGHLKAFDWRPGVRQPTSSGRLAALVKGSKQEKARSGCVAQPRPVALLEEPTASPAFVH